MARILRRHVPKGFTLIELLIVVAIIGVLSTIGIPTFRRMVAKAKKSEAKVALGGLFTVQSAFRTEYNTFGNRLSRIGFEIEGGQRNYSVGFPTDACGSVPLQPSEAATIATLTAQYPTYNTGNDTAAVAIVTVSLRSLGAAQVAPPAGGPAVATLVCNTNGLVAGLATAVAVADNGTTFLASATGPISPGVQTTSAAATGCDGVAAAICQDVWTIDQNRNLTNLVDGALN